MKKRISTLVLAMSALIVCTGSIKAQDVTFGVRGGANLSSMNGDVPKTKYVFKYQIGATVDVGFTDNFYLITGLDLQTKGTKSKPKDGTEVKYNPMYLQIPVHAAYKFDVAPQGRLVVEAGPYVAYGISGKMKGGGEKVNFFGDDRFKRFDFGLGAGIGYEYSHFVVKGGYDFGLIDISDVKGVKARNHNAYLTVGYRF
ncbi:MAG TPA: PorT family protein [Dysgonomonas sp.]|nr:PorT family protein [Dysgonomonas sp.]